MRRGEAAASLRKYTGLTREPLQCFVGWGGANFDCGRPAVMEVYGLPMCEVHGEEAASGALEELAVLIEWESTRPLNPYIPGLNPDLEAALKRAAGTSSAELQSARGAEEHDLLAGAFPLDRERTDAETLAYVEEPDADWCAGQAPPFDNCLDVRRLICRHMREAFEEGAFWLVEMLEAKREEVSAQAAYALALEKEAGLR